MKRWILLATIGKVSDDHFSYGIHPGNVFLDSDFCNTYKLHANAICLGGGIGRRKGLKIPRSIGLCGFDSRPRHQRLKDF